VSLDLAGFPVKPFRHPDLVVFEVVVQILWPVVVLVVFLTR
jgi:hypothetical protein